MERTTWKSSALEIQQKWTESPEKQRFTLTHKAHSCVLGRGQWPRGFSEEWPNQGRVRDCERHREEGEAVPWNPLCPATCGPPPPGGSPECRALGWRERLHATAPRVRLNDPWIKQVFFFVFYDSRWHLVTVLCLFQMHPRSWKTYKCLSSHVSWFHCTGAFWRLSVSKCVHSSRRKKWRQAAGELKGCKCQYQWDCDQECTGQVPANDITLSTLVTWSFHLIFTWTEGRHTVSVCCCPPACSSFLGQSSSLFSLDLADMYIWTGQTY